MNTIPLPTKCLTLLPPWPQAIALEHEDAKRLENRGYGVARQLEGFRGHIGLSQSKVFKVDYFEDDVIDQASTVVHEFGLKKRALGNPETWRLTAGKLWLVAELTRIVSPDEMARVDSKHGLAEAKRWHVAGQFGLILGSVWEVKPMPCSGGVGAWLARWCAACGHIQADSQGDRCRGCKEHGTLRDGGDRPQLKVVKECVT
jgi:hypothetical protein